MNRASRTPRGRRGQLLARIENMETELSALRAELAGLEDELDEEKEAQAEEDSSKDAGADN